MKYKYFIEKHGPLFRTLGYTSKILSIFPQPPSSVSENKDSEEVAEIARVFMSLHSEVRIQEDEPHFSEDGRQKEGYEWVSYKTRCIIHEIDRGEREHTAEKHYF